MKTKRIAITGGIGSGKSTLVEYVRKAGYPCFSCDAIYRELRQSPAYVEKIRTLFPECVSEGKIDIPRLSNVVFADAEKRKALNAISHPVIMQTLQESMQTCASPLVFAEVPLLFEGGYEREFDEIIVVTRKKEFRIASLRQRDGSAEAEIVEKIASQFDYDGEEANAHYKKYAVWIFENNGVKADLEEQMKKWFSHYKTSKKSQP